MNPSRPIKKAVRRCRARPVASRDTEPSESATNTSGIEENTDRQLLNAPACIKLLASNKKLSDVTFVFPANDNKCCEAHKLVLAMRSQVFDAMFYGPMSEISSEIVVTDVDVESFQMLLQYIYTDTADLNGDTVFQCVFAADKYGVNGLKDRCSEFVISNLNVNNVLTVYKQAQFFNMDRLLQKCKQLIALNAEALLGADWMLDLPQSDLEDIMCEVVLKSSEENNFKFAHRWAEHQCKNMDVTPENLRSVLGDVLYKIRLPLLSPQVFDNVVSPTHILKPEEQQEVTNFFCAREVIEVGRVGKFSSVPRCNANLIVEFGNPDVESTSTDYAITFRLMTPLPLQIMSLTVPKGALSFVHSFLIFQDRIMPKAVTRPGQVYDASLEKITFLEPLSVPAGKSLKLWMHPHDKEDSELDTIDEIKNVTLSSPMIVHFGEIPVTFCEIPKGIRNIEIRFHKT